MFGRKIPSWLAFMLMSVCVVANGQDRDRGPKRPWEWTDEERVAERFNPNAIAARNAAYRAAEAARGRATTSSVVERSDGKLEYVIEGRRNPELFLPFELFDMLVAGADPSVAAAEKAHAALDPGIRKLGLDPNIFWSQLSGAAGQYVHAHLSGEKSGASPCDRRNAMIAAESAVGHDVLYRVLYLVVAPTTVYASVTDSSHPGVDLLNVEKGCAR